MKGFLIIDKPSGWTSHDVVAKMRGLLKERKIGHLGTLDPLATGVLVLAVGREATKKISEYMKLEKEYEVEMELGKVSDTYDVDGKVEIADFDLKTLQRNDIVRAMEGFWGDTMQIPPAFSAKKINGKRAYSLARAGIPVELKAVPVRMEGSDIQINIPVVKFKVKVSSGTYVRSLVHDIGQKLGCGAVVTALRRTQVGDFMIKNAQKIEDFRPKV
ncbi:tRNA pseudouridine(55) synthase TruB [Candidatus Peregrinibacteria bacterium]|nr:tRNA pseudouridine(55) synthase TruB [Candidatus Peregrinibacteria bacterium]